MLFTFERFFICLRVLFIICVDFQSKLKRFTASWQRNLHRANSTKQISQTKYQIAPIKLPESTKNVNIPWIQIGWKETFLTNKVLQITFFSQTPTISASCENIGGPWNICTQTPQIVVSMATTRHQTPDQVDVPVSRTSYRDQLDVSARWTS